MVKIGEKITASRTKLHLTQEELALRLNKSVKTIQRIESNELVPDQDTLFKISSVLDIPVANLIDG